MNAALWRQIIIAVSTLLASLLGYLLAGVNDRHRDARAAEREREARTDERSAASEATRHQFQLETLLALQDTVQIVSRLTMQLMLFDLTEAREGRYHTQVPDEPDRELLKNRMNVRRLQNRLLDAELRDQLEKYQSEAVEGTFSIRFDGLTGDALEAAADSHLSDFGTKATAIMNAIGIALRRELEWSPPLTK